MCNNCDCRDVQVLSAGTGSARFAQSRIAASGSVRFAASTQGPVTPRTHPMPSTAMGMFSKAMRPLSVSLVRNRVMAVIGSAATALTRMIRP